MESLEIVENKKHNADIFIQPLVARVLFYEHIRKDRDEQST